MRERTPSKSCIGRDIELLVLEAQKILRICCTPPAWDDPLLVGQFRHNLRWRRSNLCCFLALQGSWLDKTMVGIPSPPKKKLITSKTESATRRTEPAVHPGIQKQQFRKTRMPFRRLCQYAGSQQIQEPRHSEHNFCQKSAVFSILS